MSALVTLPGIALPASDFTQRWNERRHSFRHTSEGGFDQGGYDVAELDETTAKAFVERHHYSGSYSASLQRYGLWARGGQLVGVAVLGNGGFKPVLTGSFPELEPYTESSELTRLVLLDEVPANAESWFLARAFDLAHHQGMRGIVSHSDPLRRTDAQGRVIMPGHIGVIYQASNARYAGLSTPRTNHYLPDGTLFDEQAKGKIRLQKRGHRYAEEKLIAWGAKPRTRRQDPKAWLAQALDQAGCTRLRHPGQHRYLFALGDKRQRRAISMGFAPLPYPKQEVAA